MYISYIFILVCTIGLITRSTFTISCRSCKEFVMRRSHHQLDHSRQIGDGVGPDGVGLTNEKNRDYKKGKTETKKKNADQTKH